MKCFLFSPAFSVSLDRRTLPSNDFNSRGFHANQSDHQSPHRIENRRRQRGGSHDRLVREGRRYGGRIQTERKFETIGVRLVLQTPSRRTGCPWRENGSEIGG